MTTRKTIFFTGKGGVGKSTLSAALSWQLAEKGYKVLTVSLDPAHNLGDVFETPLNHKKKTFSNNLYLQEIDLDKLAGKYLKQNMSLMQEVYSYLTPFNMEKYFNILKYSPGIEEYASLTALDEILTEEQDFDYIVFDTPPTGLTLRILALARITLTWLDKLIAIRKEILEKRHTIHNITGKYNEKVIQVNYDANDDKVLQKLFMLQERYNSIKNCLESKSNYLVVVFNPDLLSLKESERLIHGLEELDLPVRVALNNKIDDCNKEIVDDVEQQLFAARKYITVKRINSLGCVIKQSYIINDDLTEFFI